MLLNYAGGNIRFNTILFVTFIRSHFDFQMCNLLKDVVEHYIRLCLILELEKVFEKLFAVNV